MQRDPYYELPFVSQSTLKVFMRSKPEYKYAYVDGNRTQISTQQTSLGSLIHCMLLEPEKLGKTYATFDEAARPEPDKNFSSLKNKAWKKQCEEDAATHGIHLVTPAVWAQADAMLQVVCAHVLAVSFLYPDDNWQIFREQDIVWQNELSELPLKSKLDIILVDPVNAECVVVDYKSTSASTLTEFGWSVKKYGYDIQDAFYQDAARYWLQEKYPGVDFVIQVLFIPQKSTAPYQVLGVVELDAVTVSNARSRYENALRELEGCLHTGIWEEDLGVQVLNLSGKPVELPELNLEYTPLPWT